MIGKSWGGGSDWRRLIGVWKLPKSTTSNRIILIHPVRIEVESLERLIRQNNSKDKEVSLISSCSFQVFLTWFLVHIDRYRIYGTITFKYILCNNGLLSDRKGSPMIMNLSTSNCKSPTSPVKISYILYFELR